MKHRVTSIEQVNDADLRITRNDLDRPITFRVALGTQLRVMPQNPQCKRHRGRTCTVVAVGEAFMPEKAQVRFHDTNRVGLVRLSDLLPIET